MLREYLRKDTRLAGIAVLLHWMKTNLPLLKEQIDLIERTLEKLE